MAKSRIPNPLERRHLVERELSPEQASALADAYLADGRAEEAVAFLAKAGADDRLRALFEEATEAGSVFLLKQIAPLLAVEPTPDDWQRAAAAARAKGNDLYAEAAQRLANRSDD
jgi:hypothetical protein